MISMPSAPTAPTSNDSHRVAGVSEKLKNDWPIGRMKASAASATIDPTSAAFQGRNGRVSTTRIQNAVNSNEIVAAVDGCQQMTFAASWLDSVCTRHSDAGGAPTALRANMYETRTTIPETTPAGTANRSTPVSYTHLTLPPKRI